MDVFIQQIMHNRKEGANKPPVCVVAKKKKGLWSYDALSRNATWHSSKRNSSKHHSSTQLGPVAQNDSKATNQAWQSARQIQGRSQHALQTQKPNKLSAYRLYWVNCFHWHELTFGYLSGATVVLVLKKLTKAFQADSWGSICQCAP